MKDNGVYAEISEKLGVKARYNASLASMCSYGTGGNASAIFYPESEDAVRLLDRTLRERNLPFVYLGGGTNVLVSDNGYFGAVISTSDLKGITVNGKILTAKAGDKISDIMTSALYNSLGGIEFLSGIPASVGGAVAMNAGCFGKSVGDYVSYVVAVSGIYPAGECGFGYRTSRFLTENDGVLSVCFNLDNAEYEQSENKITYFTAMRRRKQPIGKSAGSVFKNDGYFAGKVIESCDLKGLSEGNAFVSEKHANFIIAKNGATSTDIRRLIEKIKAAVKEKRNVELVEEIRYLGEFENEDKF